MMLKTIFPGCGVRASLMLFFQTIKFHSSVNLLKASVFNTTSLFLYTGSQNQKVQEAGHQRLEMHKLGGKFLKGDCERLFRQLVLEGVLAEDLHITAQDHTVCYVKLGKKAEDLMRGSHKVRSLRNHLKSHQYLPSLSSC